MTKPPTGGFFIYHCSIGNTCVFCVVPTTCDKGVYYGLEALV